MKKLLLLLLLSIHPAYAGTMLLMGVGSPVVPSAPAFQGVGDVVGSAQAYWGLRGYNAAYAGNAVQLCTPADATCSDVTIVSGGLNPTTLASLGCDNGATICTAKIIYSQTGTYCTGAACTVTQNTIGSRAVFKINCVGSLPCLQSTSSTVYSCLSNGTFPGQPYSLTAAAQRYANFTSTSGIYEGQSSAVGFNFTTSTNTVKVQGGGSFTATASDSAFHAFEVVMNGASPNSIIVVDGSATTGTLTGSANGGNIGPWCGNDPRGSVYLLELGLWGSAFNATQYGDLNTNQHAYWGF